MISALEALDRLVEGNRRFVSDGRGRNSFESQARRSELVELRFAGTVFVDATRFDAFIADSSADALARQRVDAGDANAEVESSTTAVRLPVGQRLLANVSMGPRVFSPNGDGINDALRVEFDLVNVLVPRWVGLRIYNLTGRLVWVRESTPQGPTRAIASATFSTASPPARMTGTATASTIRRLTLQS